MKILQAIDKYTRIVQRWDIRLENQKAKLEGEKDLDKIKAITEEISRVEKIIENNSSILDLLVESIPSSKDQVRKGSIVYYMKDNKICSDRVVEVCYCVSQHNDVLQRSKIFLSKEDLLNHLRDGGK